jgi:hypothetical protein
MIRLNLLDLTGKVVGSCVFKDLVRKEQGSYHCDPQGLLTIEEISILRDSLLRLPAIHEGTVGRYTWKEVLD